MPFGLYYPPFCMSSFIAPYLQDLIVSRSDLVVFTIIVLCPVSQQVFESIITIYSSSAYKLLWNNFTFLFSKESPIIDQIQSDLLTSLYRCLLRHRYKEVNKKKYGVANLIDNILRMVICKCNILRHDIYNFIVECEVLTLTA